MPGAPAEGIPPPSIRLPSSRSKSPELAAPPVEVEAGSSVHGWCSFGEPASELRVDAGVNDWVARNGSCADGNLLGCSPEQ